jgi:hypothetical protein
MSFGPRNDDAFRDFFMKKQLLHFLMRSGFLKGDTAWRTLKAINRANPELRARQKY